MEVCMEIDRKTTLCERLAKTHSIGTAICIAKENTNVALLILTVVGCCSVSTVNYNIATSCNTYSITGMI